MLTHSFKTKPVIPEWMAVIANDSSIRVHEMAEIFNVTNGQINKLARGGVLPPPVSFGHFNGRVNRAQYWKMGAVRAFVEALV
jgi:hypothetical protein